MVASPTLKLLSYFAIMADRMRKKQKEKTLLHHQRISTYTRHTLQLSSAYYDIVFTRQYNFSVAIRFERWRVLV